MSWFGELNPHRHRGWAKIVKIKKGLENGPQNHAMTEKRVKGWKRFSSAGDRISFPPKSPNQWPRIFLSSTQFKENLLYFHTRAIPENTAEVEMGKKKKIENPRQKIWAKKLWVEKCQDEKCLRTTLNTAGSSLICCRKILNLFPFFSLVPSHLSWTKKVSFPPKEWEGLKGERKCPRRKKKHRQGL